MKDGEGNEWVLVPVNATEALMKPFHDVAFDEGSGGSPDYESAWSDLIAAAPQFVAGEVTKEMCWNVFEDCDGCEKNMAETARHWLDRWRKELGPALGLVTREEMARSVEIRDTEIARLETDLELARRDAERLDWFRTLTPHKLARIRAAFMPDSAGDVRATIDAARAGNGGGV